MLSCIQNKKKKKQIEKSSNLKFFEKYIFNISFNFSHNKVYPQLAKRSEKIVHSDLFRLSSLRKIFEKSYVLITNQIAVEQIASHYYKYRWHQASNSRFPSVGNYPMRYGLDPTIRAKIQDV